MSHSHLFDILNIFSRLDPVFLPVTWEANILWVWPALELQLELLWWHTSGRYHSYFMCFQYINTFTPNYKISQKFKFL